MYFLVLPQQSFLLGLYRHIQLRLLSSYTGKCSPSYGESTLSVLSSRVSQSSSVKCQVSGDRCQVTGVRCQVSGEIWRVARVICHLSPVTNANSQSPPHDNSLIMNSKNPKTQRKGKIQNAKKMVDKTQKRLEVFQYWRYTQKSPVHSEPVFRR